MRIEKTMHCIASVKFPLMFYVNGYETDELEDRCLQSYDECVRELETYDETHDYQILAVKITYEI